MKRIRIIFTPALITSLILFAPDFCNAQKEEKYNIDYPTISYLKGKLAYLNEELEALHKDLEYVMLMTDSRYSKKEVQKLSLFSDQQALERPARLSNWRLWP